MSEDPPNRTESGQFPPGVSGNPNGRPKDQFSFMGILRSALAEENKSGHSVGERIVRRYIKLALQGNQQAAEALMARIDGKPAQSLTLKGDSDAPLHVRHSARLEQAAKPKLPAPEQEQEAVEGELGPAYLDTDGNTASLDTLDIGDPPLSEQAAADWDEDERREMGDTDHQPPDVAKDG